MRKGVHVFILHASCKTFIIILACSPLKAPRAGANCARRALTGEPCGHAYHYGDSRTQCVWSLDTFKARTAVVVPY